jgi:hypothetical protein
MDDFGKLLQNGAITSAIRARLSDFASPDFVATVASLVNAPPAWPLLRGAVLEEGASTPSL